MGKRKIFSYDGKYDILYLRLKDTDYNNSVEFPNAVVDLDKDGLVICIRIFEASKVFGISEDLIQLPKMNELWNNEADKDWENA